MVSLPPARQRNPFLVFADAMPHVMRDVSDQRECWFTQHDHAGQCSCVYVTIKRPVSSCLAFPARIQKWSILSSRSQVGIARLGQVMTATFFSLYGTSETRIALQISVPRALLIIVFRDN